MDFLIFILICGCVSFWTQKRTAWWVRNHDQTEDEARLKKYHVWVGDLRRQVETLQKENEKLKALLFRLGVGPQDDGSVLDEQISEEAWNGYREDDRDHFPTPNPDEDDDYEDEVCVPFGDGPGADEEWFNEFQKD